jgi:hypothetical protein
MKPSKFLMKIRRFAEVEVMSEKTFWYGPGSLCVQPYFAASIPAKRANNCEATHTDSDEDFQARILHLQVRDTAEHTWLYASHILNLESPRSNKREGEYQMGERVDWNFLR